MELIFKKKEDLPYHHRRENLPTSNKTKMGVAGFWKAIREISIRFQNQIDLISLLKEEETIIVDASNIMQISWAVLGLGNDYFLASSVSNSNILFTNGCFMSVF
jgi:hypothetical protein